MSDSKALALMSKDPAQWIRREVDRDPRLKSDETKRGYKADLKAFNAWRGDRPMTKLLVEEYAASLQGEHKSPNSINRALSAVRWWARRIGEMAFEERGLDRAEREEIVTQTARVASIENVTGKRKPKGRHIAPGELAALMRACAQDRSAAGARDATIIAIAWASGGRRSEIAGLELKDWKQTGDAEGDITIKGKGDKVRTVYIYNGAAEALIDWLAIRGDKPGPMFYAINKGGRVRFGHGVSDEAIALMLDKRKAQAGISEALTWHDFRRTFAGNLLDTGTDLATVQQLMGHESANTTAHYDRRGEEVKRKAVRSLHVPYTRRGK